MTAAPPCHDLHRLILHGRCPRCQVVLVNGESAETPSLSEPGERRWNTSAFFEILAGNDSWLQEQAMVWLFCYGPYGESVLPVLREALTHSRPMVRSHAILALMKWGS